MDSTIKSLFDFIKEIFQFRFLIELPKIFFQPRNFFSKIENEDDKTTFKRILFYALFYWIIIYVLQITFLKGTAENFTFKIIGSLIIDISIFAILVSPLLILLKLVKPKVSIKTFITFLLLIRFNLLFFFLLFHILFIVQENYLFVAFKWLAIYAYYFLLIFAIPFIFSFNLVNRLKLIVVAVVIVLTTTFLYSQISFKLKLNWKYDIYNLFGDPIGEEVETVMNKFSNPFSERETPNLLPLDYLLQLSSFEQLGLKDSIINKQKICTSLVDSLQSLLSFVKFNTTREFLLIQINYINSINRFYVKWYEFMNQLEKLNHNGVELHNLKNDVDEGFRVIDSLYLKISYIFDLKPDSAGKINVNHEDTRLLRKVMMIAEVNNNLAKIYILVKEEYNKLQKENIILNDVYIKYLDKQSNFLELKYILYKFRLIAPNPY